MADRVRFRAAAWLRICIRARGDGPSPGCAPGGIGASSFPSRVWKGQHFPGHMGNERVTVKNLRVIKVDNEENLLLVRGAVPGPKGCYLLIRKAKRGK